MTFEEVSAKTGLNINKAMTKFAEETLESKAIHVPARDIYMNFLLFLNEDFDDDLLSDVIHLLTFE